MRRVSVQGMYQRRSVQDQPNPRVAMTVDPPLVTLRQAEPPLQIEIVLDRFILLLADEEAGQEAEHHRRYAEADRILGRLEAIDQRLELLLAFRDVLSPRLQRRGHLRDHSDVFPDHFLLLVDFIQAPLDEPR